MPSLFRHLAFLLLATFSILSPLKSYALEYDPGPTSLQWYKPMYGIVGSPDTKIQLSFKVKLVDDLFPESGTYGNLYFGYTQLIMWEILAESGPFRDINYNPDLFYRMYLDQNTWFDIGLFEHESNGKDFNDSREWNRSYLRFQKRYAFDSGMALMWRLKAWVPYANDEIGPIMAEYRGIWELTVGLIGFFPGAFQLSDLLLRVYGGGGSWVNPAEGGQELTLRLKVKDAKLLPTFIVQAFHGYGENMLNAHEDRWGMRFGFGI